MAIYTPYQPSSDKKAKLKTYLQQTDNLYQLRSVGGRNVWLLIPLGTTFIGFLVAFGLSIPDHTKTPYYIGIFLPVVFTVTLLCLVGWFVSRNRTQQKLYSAAQSLDGSVFDEEKAHLTAWFSQVGVVLQDPELLEKLVLSTAYEVGPSYYELKMETPTGGIVLPQIFCRDDNTNDWVLETRTGYANV